MTDETQSKTHKFKAEVTQVLSLVINSLYSNKEIFLRELISNASDALDKLRFEAIAKPALLPEGQALEIRLLADAEAGTLTVWDSGVGMSEAALTKDLGTVAHSGTQRFMEKLQEAKADADAQLIGRFGVGFYSGYLVADRIEVVSRAAGSGKAARWVSDGKESFSVEPAEREVQGTSVVLHLRPEHKSLLESWKLRELVSRYSDFISYPIKLRKDDGSYEAINQASALWKRDKKDISEEQYQEFWQHLSHDWEKPLARSHFKAEGTQSFTALLFVPQRPPFDLSGPEGKHGVRLYVRRVFIMDNCEELLPRWLRFVRGIVDSDDLPLNVSREVLQDSALVTTIKKQVTRRVLEMLTKLAKDDEAAYAGFWQRFGNVLKEGLHFEPAHKDKLAPLLRYESSTVEGLVSLEQYVARMASGQTKIYYALGPSRALLQNSPQLEQLRARGFEILYMTHGVDQWAVEGLEEFEGKPLANAMEADLAIDAAAESAEGAKNEPGQATEAAEAAIGPLLERCKQVLADHVSEVRASRRLTESAACLVLPKGGLPAHLERMIRAYQEDLPQQKRILELNPGHPLIDKLRTVHAADASSAQVQEWIELLYDQALLSEGSPLPDPARFVKRVSTLMQHS
jgi:molecular chaperone HtpG